jgi:hypothetical protein
MGRSTVFINEMVCEVPTSPLNVKSVFGANAVLLHSSGFPVPTDEFHNTFQPLQHGASYYVALVRIAHSRSLSLITRCMHLMELMQHGNIYTVSIYISYACTTCI